MKIFDFEVEQELQDLDSFYVKVSSIKSILSEKRNEFRHFCTQINLENETLFSCCNEYEKLLTIQCYTFSERLLKNLVYALIKKDGHTSLHINSFINKKVPVESFSPNVKLDAFENEIRTFFKDFKFIFNPKHVDSKIYNELIKERHLLAHVGKYSFNFDQYMSVINIIKLLSFESKSIILFQDEIEQRSTMQRLFLNLKDNIVRIRTSDSNSIKPFIKLLKQNYLDIIKFFQKHNIQIESLVFENEFNELNKFIQSCDLRESSSKLIDELNKSRIIDQTFMSLIRGTQNSD